MKAVIPAAGLGTRFLPATKAQPKEMLPVVDKPAIQYVVEEAVASGIKDIIIVTGRGKRSIEDHFDKSFELEFILKRAGKTKELETVQKISNLANIHFIRQKEQKGLGDAILCAKEFVGNEPFAVLLGDDIIMSDVPCTKQLISIYKKYKSPIIAVEQLPRNKIERYGIIKYTGQGPIYHVVDLIEKPKPEEAPSNLGIIGRYILTPEIFDYIEDTKPGKNNEVHLTDALKSLSKTQKIYAYLPKGKRYDLGNKMDWLKVNLELAVQRKDMSVELTRFIMEKFCKKSSARIHKK
ncbi:MAG: UTP--glucose-1-phosphate uridylyltransferase GalU [Nanoarchaeota archaeon]|nr:UTP--glucose-1-phosphate uridylyltransferase GalU [Nanoarchaeota archaeon]MCG2718662.1 UTP--glucose-1-phosphate uridylyltransferase GalU [Nanoarchaeota archaeon]